MYTMLLIVKLLFIVILLQAGLEPVTTFSDRHTRLFVHFTITCPKSSVLKKHYKSGAMIIALYKFRIYSCVRKRFICIFAISYQAIT